jgi:hypothetical protein
VLAAWDARKAANVIDMTGRDRDADDSGPFDILDEDDLDDIIVNEITAEDTLSDGIPVVIADAPSGPSLTRGLPVATAECSNDPVESEAQREHRQVNEFLSEWYQNEDGGEG